jgi:hypothetical protein
LYRYQQNSNLGLKISNAKAVSDELHSKIWDVYCGIDVIFSASGIFKLFYNSKEDSMVRAAQIGPMPMMPPRPGI